MRRALVMLISLLGIGSAALVVAPTTQALAAPPGTKAASPAVAVQRGHETAPLSVQRTTARYPSAPTGPVKARPGPGAGEVTFRWSTKGRHTDYFKLETATSPFANGARDHSVFKIGPTRRHYTLSATQTRKAGAGAGTAWTLVWRLSAVNEAKSGRQVRYFGHDQSRVRGAAPTGSGSALRVASYNIRTNNVAGSHALRYAKRVPRVAQMIKSRKPGIVLVQELFPSMVRQFRTALHKKGMGNYALNRGTPVRTGARGQHLFQSRILYDTTRYAAGNCNTRPKSTDCLIKWPADGGPDYASYLRLRDRATGQKFYVVSLHLPNEQKPGMDAIRREAMRVIVEKIGRINTGHLPVIVGGDTNSSQLTKGVRPHDILMRHGFYDTASAVEQVNAKFGTMNGFKHQKASPFGISPRIDVIATLGMPGSAKFVNEVIKKGRPFPSDHNMIWADLRLP